jgi:hypothetical protein
MKINWNDAAEGAIKGGLGMIPEVGGILSTLVSIFWPKSDDVWSQMKGQVEQLVKQEISELVYADVQDDLNGLKDDLADYTAALSTNDSSWIEAKWSVADGTFDDALPHFQAKGYELLLLPLFTQFANLNFSLLRDGIVSGEAWGWNSKVVDQLSSKLEQRIADFTTYANNVYAAGYAKASLTFPNFHECQPFLDTNAYVRQMTLTVLDFVNLWPYFGKANDPAHPVEIHLSREIYSDPCGTCDDSEAITLASPPTLPISQLTVWGGDFIDAVQLTYPDGGGPNGKTVTPRMGTQPNHEPFQHAGSNQPPHGGVFDLSNNPVTEVLVYAGDVVNAFQFTLKNGDKTGMLGNNNGRTLPRIYSYRGEILSSIHINGVSKAYGTADCAVFGFQYERTQKADLDALGRLYVASPSSLTLNDLAARSVTKQVAMDQLTAKASAENWDTQRAEYRKLVEARTLATQSA